MQTFEMFVEEHDEAGQVRYRVEMTPQKKRGLLIATLRDPADPPAKGVDGPDKGSLVRRVIADLPNEQIDILDKVVTLLTSKSDEKHEDLISISSHGC